MLSVLDTKSLPWFEQALPLKSSLIQDSLNEQYCFQEGHAKKCCHSATESLTPKTTMCHSATYKHWHSLVFIKWKYTLSKWPTIVVFTKWINNTFEFTTRIPLVYINETGYLPHSQLHVESGRLLSVISSLSIRLGTKFTLTMYTTLH